MNLIPVMTAEQFEWLDTEQATNLIRERFRVITARGHSLEAAILFSVHPEIDLDAATGLLTRGCPPEVALRILQ